MRCWLLSLLAACSFDHGSAMPERDATVETYDASSDGAVDAETVADAPISGVVCPSSYSTMTTMTSGSRYRVIATPTSFANHHAACNADKPGSTHLASIETEAEMFAVQAALLAIAADQYYIGAVQKPSQATTTAGWFAFTGVSLPAGHFGNANDDDPGEDNQENLGSIST
ncbi:MAG TPA: C-type lectin domain-containing protein, partial [Kofleriaceae bacterium]